MIIELDKIQKLLNRCKVQVFTLLTKEVYGYKPSQSVKE